MYSCNICCCNNNNSLPEKKEGVVKYPVYAVVRSVVCLPNDNFVRTKASNLRNVVVRALICMPADKVCRRLCLVKEIKLLAQVPYTDTVSFSL